MRRPDVFTLDYGHPLAQGLVFGLLNPKQGNTVTEDSLARRKGTLLVGTICASDASIGRMCIVSTTEEEDRGVVFNSVPLGSIGDNGPFTMSAMRYAIPSNNFIIFSEARGAGYYRNALWFSENAIGYDNYPPSGGSVSASLSLQARKWAHVSIVCSGTALLYYIDGKYTGSLTRDVYDSAAYPLDSLRIGSTNPDAGIYKRFIGRIADPIIHNRALSSAEIAILADRTDPMLGGLIVEERPVLYFDMGGSENKTGVLAITNDSSLGIGGIKGALGSASFTASAAFSPGGIKSATGYVSFSSASEFGVSGILEQSDDKVGAVVFVNESIVGASGVKNALGGFGVSNTAEFGVSGAKGVLMPELSQASGAAVSSSEISGSVHTNKNTGTLYAVATLSSTKPSVTQIQAGQNHLGASAPYATSQAVTTYGLQSVAADGLTFNTPYYWHFQHKDGEAIDSTVITSSAVQTLDASITLDFPDTAPCSLLGYQVWSKLTVTDEEIAALWGE
jgi:hypothetical protein